MVVIKVTKVMLMNRTRTWLLSLAIWSICMTITYKALLVNILEKSLTWIGKRE